MTPSPRHALLWSVLNALGTKGTNFVVYLYLARALGPKAFGIVALGLAITGFIEIVCEHKFSTILIQKEELSEIEKSSVFYFQFAGGLLFAGVIVGGSGPLGRLFHEPTLGSVLPWLALAMVLNTTTYVHEALLKRALKFKVLTLRSMTANVVGGLVGIGLAYFDFGVASMIAMLLTSSAAGAAVLWKTSGWRPRQRFSSSEFLPMYRAARYVAATAIAGAAALQGNMFIVGLVFGASVAGLYAFALRIYDVLMRITTFSISDAAFPIFARKIADLPDYRSAFAKLLMSGGAITVGILMIIGASSASIIAVFFGEQWAPAAKYLLIYLVAGAIVSLGAYNDVTLLAFGKTKEIAQAYFFGVVVWIAQLSFIAALGPIFPAISWVVKEAILFPVKARWAVRLMQMSARQYLKLTLPVVGAGIAACVSVFLVQYAFGARSIWSLVCGGGVGLVVYVAVVGVFGWGSISALRSQVMVLMRRR